MKTTLELPDDLFRQTKATASLRGESMKSFVIEALRRHLSWSAKVDSGPPAWKLVFGQAEPEEVAEIDRAIEGEFERIDPDDWR